MCIRDRSNITGHINELFKHLEAHDLVIIRSSVPLVDTHNVSRSSTMNFLDKLSPKPILNHFGKYDGHLSYMYLHLKAKQTSFFMTSYSKAAQSAFLKGQVSALLHQGQSVRQVSCTLGVPKSTVHRWRANAFSLSTERLDPVEGGRQALNLIG